MGGLAVECFGGEQEADLVMGVMGIGGLAAAEADLVLGATGVGGLAARLSEADLVGVGGLTAAECFGGEQVADLVLGIGGLAAVEADPVMGVMGVGGLAAAEADLVVDVGGALGGLVSAEADLVMGVGGALGLPVLRSLSSSSKLNMRSMGHSCSTVWFGEKHDHRDGTAHKREDKGKEGSQRWVVFTARGSTGMPPA